MIPADTLALIERALDWATLMQGNPKWALKCLGFVEAAYEHGNNIEVFGYSSAREAADHYTLIDGEAMPPRGALIFFDLWGVISGDYRNWGHVGISLGDGTLIHAWDVVRVDRNEDIAVLPTAPGWLRPCYIGWAHADDLLRGCVYRQWGPFQLVVDDNAHYMDEESRSMRRVYELEADALRAAHEIVDATLVDEQQSGLHGAELLRQYKQFGDDPSITNSTFSAWDYATWRSRIL